MPTDEEIREICARVTLAQSPEQFKAAITELKIAIPEHNTDAQKPGVHLLLNEPKAAAAGSVAGSEE